VKAAFNLTAEVQGMDDNEIIELFWRRNELAINAATAKYSRYCHSISYNILHNNEDADECVNDTYLRAWNAIPPARPNNLSVFLGTITRRLSLNRYKKSKAEKRGSGQIDIVLSELEEVVSDTSASFDEDMESEIIVETLNRFIARLPEKKRNVFIRRYWHLKSIEEIADDYELTCSNVKQILFRTRIQLKKALMKEGILL